MKKNIALSFILILNSILAISRNINEKLTEPNHFLFKENKGQLHDQHNKVRKDILYYSSDGKINLYLKKEGVSMQLSKLNKSDSLNHTTSTQFSRVDIQWLNANKNCVIKNEGEQLTKENYYDANCQNGALNVKNYNKIIYNNIYNDIDLIWYQSDGKLKYDFIINPGADYKDIQINYQGADYISINKLGELVISTSLGKIIEQAPLVFQNKKTLKAKWKIQNNIISFDITGANKNMPITIDPGLRMWGTYYGGSSYEEIFKTVTDKDNNVYVSGYTSSTNNIATSGSFQSSLNIGAGGSNSFLAKFNSNGVRLWSTYYGDQFDGGNAKCAVDNLGNIFLLSYISTTPIPGTGTTYATTGTQNPISAGNAECYLVKFNSAGQRVWGTFFGGPNDEFPIDCAADNIGNVYITGQTNSKTLIASPSSHQINAGSASTADNDYFIAKFTSNGLRVWSTYYGGSSQEDYYDGSLSVDNVNNVYFASNTKSSDINAIATIGSHQSLYGGITNYNGFLVKFNPTGTRQWGTYYGGSADDIAFSCFADKVGNVYLAGKAITSSGTVIATSNGYQPSYGGGASDSYIAKFNSAGQRIWGTYYGGFGDENHTHCSIDKNCNLYLCGRTSFASTPVLTTIGSEQTNFGGVVDCFIAKLDSNSNRIWGSLYGGNVVDYPNSIVNDTIGDVYMAGYTNSTDTLKIATGGSHQSSLKGSNDGFLVKFVSTVVTSTNNPQPINNSISTTFCGSGSAFLQAGGTTGIVNWYTVPSGGTSISTGTFYVTPTLTNTTTYYADNFDGFTYSPRTAFQVTILSLPVISVTGSTIICNSSPNLLTASGANTYVWNTGANTPTISVTQTATTVFTVTGTAVNNCTSSATYTLGFNPPPTPSICLITVDSLAINNEIYWEKTLYPMADSFIVYREVSTNIYRRIGSVSKNAYSMYTDTNRSIGPNNGNPSFTYYKYKLQLRDTCGLYSPLSLWHETIHIQDQLNGNFNWNPYAIESTITPVANYNLQRLNVATGSLTLVGSTSGNNFTDPQYASFWPTGVKWLVDAVGFNCNPTAKVAAQKVKTKSNHANDKLAATSINNSYQFINNNILVYPNPAKDKLTIALNTSIQNLTIELNNILGQTLSKITNTERINIININDFASGIYLLNIKLNNKVVSVKKVIIE